MMGERILVSTFLIGFMGVGKTTIGTALAKHWDCPVFDTDQLIEKEQNRSINQIFSEKGEAYFRDVEVDMLKVVSKKSGVITTGGGIILREENRLLLKNSGRSIFLTCEPHVILERLKGDDTRPVIKEKNAADIVALFKKRLPLYKQSANIIIDTTFLSVEEVVHEINKRIKKGNYGNNSKQFF